MELVKDTNPILRQSAIEFDFNNDVDPEKLATEMAPIMFEYNGIGLAAPQVGLNYRMFLIGDPEQALACFNPKVLSISE